MTVRLKATAAGVLTCFAAMSLVGGREEKGGVVGGTAVAAVVPFVGEAASDAAVESVSLHGWMAWPLDSAGDEASPLPLPPPPVLVSSSRQGERRSARSESGGKGLFAAPNPEIGGNDAERRAPKSSKPDQSGSSALPELPHQNQQ